MYYEQQIIPRKILHFAFKELIYFRFDETFLIQKNCKLLNGYKVVQSVKLGFKPNVLSLLRTAKEKTGVLQKE